MEIIPILTLFLALPGPVEPPVTTEDLRLFPSHEVIDRECRLARRAKDYADEQFRLADRFKFHTDRAHWRVKSIEAEFAWDVLDDLRFAQTLHGESQFTYLARVRQKIGTRAFYHGQLPPPVDLNCGQRAPEVVPLPVP